MMMRRRWLWLSGVVAGLIIIVVLVSSWLMGEPLRRYVERQLNQHLKGYTVQIGGLDVHPFRLSVEMRDAVIALSAHPDPPVMRISRLWTGIQGRPLLKAQVVADVLMEHPTLHINLAQLQTVAAGDVQEQARSWQEALEAVFPFKINALQVTDGEATYMDQGPFRPLHLSQLQVQAGNLRNVWSAEHVYPSPLHLEGQIFDSGRVVIDGHANFLAEPHVALQAQVSLERIDLAYVRPILRHYHVALRQGTVSGAGSLEYAPHTQVVHLQQLTLDGVQLDYRHQPQMAGAARQAATQATQKAQEVSNKPGILLRADRVRIRKSTFGVVNQATQPPYRLFVAITEGQLTNFSNQLTQGTAVATLRGQFMGSGELEVKGTFRPETHGPDFNMAIRNEGTEMRSLSDLLRAYANISVAGGLFSLYMETTIRQGQVQGYVKPFFKDLQIPEPQQAQEKGVAHRVYEELVGGVVKLLENRRQEVATQTDLSGRLERPQTSTWEAVVGVLQNAFIRAILPGFEREVGQRR
jgi:hypothetical protein